LSTKKWYQSLYFHFNTTFSSVPLHSLSLIFRNVLGEVKLEDVIVLDLGISHIAFDLNSRFIVTLPLLPRIILMNITFKDDISFNVPILYSLLL